MWLHANASAYVAMVTDRTCVHTQSVSVPDQIDIVFVVHNCHVMVAWDSPSNVHTRDVRIQMCHSMYGSMPLLAYIHMKKAFN